VPTHPRRLGALLRAVYLVPRYSAIQSARLQDESLVRLLLTNPHGKVAMESHGRAESPRQFHARRMIAGQLIKMQSAPRRGGSAPYSLHTSWIHPGHILAVGTGFGRIPQYEYARPAANNVGLCRSFFRLNNQHEEQIFPRFPLRGMGLLNSMRKPGSYASRKSGGYDGTGH
jgi:hypothetical protein